ncbi:MAG: hypothetical protein M3Q70_00115 [bacterium]|nr:hypothetical protein [bacterium]
MKVKGNSLLAVVGPTGGGKSALAQAIAERLDGEIICADSRTVYRGLDVGTAKPTKDEQSKIVHYGLNLINADQRFSAGDFQNLAKGWIADIQKRGKLPIIVGGTGLYIDALLYNYSFTPDGASRDSKNPRHLSKLIKVKKDKLLPSSIIIGLDPGRDNLESRLRERLIVMRKSGVVEEARWLFESYGRDCPGASGNIYQALIPYFDGLETVDECFDECVRLDLQLAKRQRTWFKRNQDIQWFEDSASALTAYFSS